MARGAHTFENCNENPFLKTSPFSPPTPPPPRFAFNEHTDCALIQNSLLHIYSRVFSFLVHSSFEKESSCIHPQDSLSLSASTVIT